MAAAVCLLAGGCGEPSSGQGDGAAAGTTSQAAADPSTVALATPRATHATIANANLDFVIERWRRAQPDSNPMAARALIDGLLTRVKFRNTFADFDAALATSSGLLASGVAPADAHLLHARVLATLHQYEAALQHLDLALAAGADAEVAADARASIAVALGQAAPQIERLRARAQQQPAYGTWTALAAAEETAGQTQAADASYVQALASYDDVSPFPMAWVFKQRADLWQQQQPDLAAQLYAVALDYLPGYVEARLALAELESTRGRDQAALQHLQAAVEVTDDPDAQALLAAQLAAMGQTGAAEQYAALARAGFEALLARHPLAFANHAEEFYAGVGQDPQRAEALRQSIAASRAAALTAVTAPERSQESTPTAGS